MKVGVFFPTALNKFGGGVLGDFFAGADEMAVGAGTLRVHDAFGNAFAIEVRHLFKQAKNLQTLQGRADQQ